MIASPGFVFPERLFSISDTFDHTSSGYASAEWAEMVGNSVILTPGYWFLGGGMSFTDGLTVDNSRFRAKWASENGDNTTTAPSSLSSVNLIAGNEDTLVSLQGSISTVDLGDWQIALSQIIVFVDSGTLEVFSVCSSTFSSAGSGSFATNIFAFKIGI